jgi:2-(1,2-epoxy-1,2-dihydrophenyl)acetyl-CoA isomerase
MALIETTQSESILTLTINRPKANALNLALIGELQAALARAANDASVRCVILTGANHFGAGQDIEEIKAYGESISYREHLLKTYNPLVMQMRRIEKPLIAAVAGMCAGASLGIALACDIRVAARNAKFVVGFGGIGLAPDSGVSLMLPALIGLGRATELYAANDPIDSQTALDWGLVNRVSADDPLISETMIFAQKIAAGSIQSFALTKRLFNKTMLPQLEAVLDDEAQMQEIAGRSADHREGVAAFLEKRKPQFGTR